MYCYDPKGVGKKEKKGRYKKYMKRNELKWALEKVNLPDPKPIRHNPTSAYEKVLRQLGVSTAEEIDSLRLLVGEKIQKMSFKIQLKAFRDLTLGKYSSIEEVPL